MRTKKYLVETSAVRGIVGPATAQQQHHFLTETEDGELHTSVYLRKEFIHRWVCDCIRFACTVAQCTSVADALILLEQDFSPRNVKGTVAVIAKYLQDVGAMGNAREAAEELASIAVRYLRDYDRKLPSRVNNSVGCQIGGRKPDVDFNHIVRDVQVFYALMKQPVVDCPINKYLQLDKPHSRADKIIADPAAGKLPVSLKLAEFREHKKHITCTECAKIGDAVIAMEQPKSTCLVHLDNSFNDLCGCLAKDHKQPDSVSLLAKSDGFQRI